ncbi:hypothetical protein [Nonomuraea lactucae]|uniref:hypothetical protein n=1 Tax=Nonomuraea lactucae TaxID=2249762 RepID=UPI000DE2246E|nr:hypothetical protein [Nonomuraea lactucae]
MSELVPFHGIHPIAACAGCGRVSWFESLPRAERVRVRAHTCECLATTYELCAAGGLFFVRRTDRGYATPEVMESTWMTMRETEVLWLRLVNGLAR